MASPDVCPPSGLLTFVSEGGAVARMAVVKRVTTSAPASEFGRYVVGPKIAAGGMATVHLGRLVGPAGFSRTVAIKRLHPNLASDPELVRRFVDEARIASRIRHANVVPTLDVVERAREVLLVLEYVHGESLARLLRIAASRGERVPPQVASAIVVGVLRGLHVAHEAKGANGAPLDLVHRDVSPQNVLVGADGVPRVLDFGIAKAADREQETITRGNPRDVKGKLAYMAPEQIAGEPLDRRCDVFAAAIILWEALSGERLFRGDDAVATMDAVFHRDPPRLAGTVDGVPPAIDDALATALAKDPTARFATADELARAIEAALPPGSDREVAEWIEAIAGEVLSARAREVAAFESTAEEEPLAPGEERCDATTLKRASIVPPPPMRAEAKTVPAFDPVPTEPPKLRTPMSMVAPVDPLAQSGMSSTRIEPVEARPPARFRTPMPIPMPAAVPKRRASWVRLALLAMAPPAVTAAVVLVTLKPAAFTKAASEVTAPAPAPAPVAADPPPVILPSPPPSATVVAASCPAPTAREAPPLPAPHARTPRPTRAVRPHKR